MINERTSAQTNTSTSTNMQYAYPTGPFDPMNGPPMQNPNDIYSYYPPSLYQPFGAFDEHNQWGSADTSAGLQQAGPLQFHAPLYTPTGLDMPRSPFDYPAPHTYPHYHPGFPPSNFPPAAPSATSAFDMSWNSQNLSIQQQMQAAAQQSMAPIGGGSSMNAKKKSSVYDDYPSASGNVGDMLAQHMSSVSLGNHDPHHYNNGLTDHSSNSGVLQSNSSSLSLSRPAQPSAPSGPKSYASVVSSDMANSNSNKMNPLPGANFPIRASNPPNDSPSMRANTQPSRTTTTIYNSRYQQHQHQQQQQQSSGNGGGFLQWANSNTDRSANNNSANRRSDGPTSRTLAANQDMPKHDPQYNPKDFNLNPKGARFFVIKSYSEDDVHRSIKYNIWCSTEHGNKRLDSAFREREGKGPIYLFFSVNASGHFCGMAEMMSPLDYEHQTDVWHMSNKWQGKFEVKWIYVKDVPNQQFRSIRLENNENKPVTNSRDTQEIPFEKGKLMLKTLHMYRHKTSIFDDFQYYESKQAEENTTKKPAGHEATGGQQQQQQQHSNRRAFLSNRTAHREQQETERDDDDE